MTQPIGESAFDEAVAIVATANTIVSLHRKLVGHPLVLYLSDRFSQAELRDRLLTEIATFDRTLHKATIVILLTLAFFRSLGGPFAPKAIKTALLNAEVKWAKELMWLYEPKNESASDVTKVSVIPVVQMHRSVVSDFHSAH